MTTIDALPRLGDPHVMVIDLAKFVRPAWHGWVNANRNEPGRVLPTALNRIVAVLQNRCPSHVVIADDAEDLFRKRLHPGYKGTRPPKPPELATIENDVRGILANAGLRVARVRGLEADDILHAAAILGTRANLPVVIVADDKDAHQIVSGERGVVVWDGAANVVDDAAVVKRWGVWPWQVVDLFALAGDAGDCVPGVHGWGPKTAAAVLKAAEPRAVPELVRPGGQWWVPEKWRKKFVENIDAIKLSYDLVRLRGEWLSRQDRFSLHEVDALDAADAILYEMGR